MALIRILLSVVLVLGFYGCKSKENNRPTNLEESIPNFEVKIFVSDYSLAYTQLYLIDNQSLSVFSMGTLEGEEDSILFRRTLDSEEKNLFFNQISGIKTDDLKVLYSDPLIEDGDQMTFSIKIGDNAKTIHLSNYFLPEAKELIEAVNRLVEEKWSINYFDSR